MGVCCGKPHAQPLPPAHGTNGRRRVEGNAAFEGAPPRLRAATATPRCTRCKAKIPVCICDVRGTMVARKLQVVRGSAAAASDNRNSAQSNQRQQMQPQQKGGQHTSSGGAGGKRPTQQQRTTKQPHHQPNQRQHMLPPQKGSARPANPSESEKKVLSLLTENRSYYEGCTPQNREDARSSYSPGQRQQMPYPQEGSSETATAAARLVQSQTLTAADKGKAFGNSARISEEDFNRMAQVIGSNCDVGAIWGSPGRMNQGAISGTLRQERLISQVGKLLKQHPHLASSYVMVKLLYSCCFDYSGPLADKLLQHGVPFVFRRDLNCYNRGGQKHAPTCFEADHLMVPWNPEAHYELVVTLMKHGLSVPTQHECAEFLLIAAGEVPTGYFEYMSPHLARLVHDGDLLTKEPHCNIFAGPGAEDATLLWLGIEPASYVDAFSWMQNALDGVFESKVLRGILFQQLGNSYTLGISSPSFRQTSVKVDAQKLFKQLQSKASSLQGDDNFARTLHKQAVRLGVAKKLGPAPLYTVVGLTQATTFAPHQKGPKVAAAIDMVLQNARTTREELQAEWAKWEKENIPPYSSQEPPTTAVHAVVSKLDLLLAAQCVVTAVLGLQLRKDVPGLDSGGMYGDVRWPPYKLLARKHVKASGDYAESPAPWACILDDLRCSIVSSTGNAQQNFVDDVVAGKLPGLTAVRAKSTMDIPTAQVKNELWNLEYRADLTFAELTKSAEFTKVLETARIENGEAFEHVWDPAKELLLSRVFAEEPVSMVMEVQLYRQEFIDAKKKSHLFYKIIRASSLADIAKDCFQFSSAGMLAYNRQDEINFIARFGRSSGK